MNRVDGLSGVGGGVNGSTPKQPAKKTMREGPLGDNITFDQLSDIEIPNESVAIGLEKLLKNSNTPVEHILAYCDKYAIDIKGLINQGMTAPHYAAKTGKTEVVEKLVKAGADVNVKGEYGGGLNAEKQTTTQTIKLLMEAEKFKKPYKFFEIFDLKYEEYKDTLADELKNEIEPKWRELLLNNHPDKVSENPNIAENIRMINKAYNCLTNPDELVRYKAASRDNNLADFF